MHRHHEKSKPHHPPDFFPSRGGTPPLLDSIVTLAQSGVKGRNFT
jgi:hypothetical protein